MPRPPPPKVILHPSGGRRRRRGLRRIDARQPARGRAVARAPRDEGIASEVSNLTAVRQALSSSPSPPREHSRRSASAWLGRFRLRTRAQAVLPPGHMPARLKHARSRRYPLAGFSQAHTSAVYAVTVLAAAFVIRARPIAVASSRSPRTAPRRGAERRHPGCAAGVRPSRARSIGAAARPA